MTSRGFGARARRQGFTKDLPKLEQRTARRFDFFLPFLFLSRGAVPLDTVTRTRTRNADGAVRARGYGVTGSRRRGLKRHSG